MKRTHDRSEAIQLGRNSMKKEILQIIRERIRKSYHEEPGGRTGFDIEFIPWQETQELIQEIEEL